MMTAKNDKSYDIDTALMRVIASFFVVLIHSSGIQTVSQILCNSVSRFSVPVFVMVSGYYMLSHQPDTRKIVRKSIRLFVLMIAWSGFYYCYDVICNQRAPSGLIDLLQYLFTQPVHLWYLYAAITLYLFTPILYIFCKNAAYKDWCYALGLTFFFGSLVIIALRSGVFPVLTTIVDKMKVPYTLGFIFLYLLGGFFRKYGIGRRDTRLLLYLLGLLGIAATFIGTLLAKKYGLPNDLFFSFFAPNVIASAAAFFVFVKQFWGAHPIQSRPIQGFLRRLGDATLGIYLLHPVFAMILQKHTGLYAEDAGILLILARAIIAWLLSAIIIHVAKKVPGLRKFV